ncbi:MAG: leucine-rich repeat protein [Acutalibacteraceae bacterium]|jgi:hypothetical protein
MKTGRKALALLLSVVFLLTVLPVISASADDNGTCGANLTWNYNSSTKTLTISGTGSMTNYEYGGAPWYTYRSSIATVIIGNSVTSIGDVAFYYCTGLTSVTIPNSVTSIGNEAFYNCAGLTSVTIGNSVTGIGWYAFSGCTGLTSVTIPDSITSIGDWAFEGCAKLTSVTIPDSVTSIGDYAFCDCTGLTRIDVEEDNPAYTSTDGVLFNKDKTVLLCYPAGKTGVYTIPNSVTSIGEDAFEYCRGLTSIIIPDSVTSIGEYAFGYCRGLTSVTIPDSVTSIGDCAFEGCTGLLNVTIPDSVTSIGSCAFNGCAGLTSITIPDSVTSIGEYAFADCTGLTSVTIPNSVTSIGDVAFYGCTGLKRIDVAEDNPAYTSTDGVLFNKDKTALICYPAGKTGVYTIPDSVTSIGEDAFEYCRGLTSIIIPDSVTSIESGAFFCCTGLTIYATTGSVAKQYASKNGHKFVAVIFLEGQACYASWTVDIPPTCIEPGSQSHHSVIGDNPYGSIAIPAAGHAYSTKWTIDVAATCEQPGIKTHHCQNCDAVIDETRIPATGHIWLLRGHKDATCTEDGYDDYVCANNSTHTKRKVITATDHAYSTEWTIDVAATCEQLGIKSHHCQKCEAVTDETNIPATGHTWRLSVRKDATCTEDGYADYVCANDSTHTKREIITATGHIYSTEWTIDKEPTCTTDGSKSRHCQRCDAVTDITAIPALGHDPQIAFDKLNGAAAKTEKTTLTIGEDGTYTYDLTQNLADWVTNTVYAPDGSTPLDLRKYKWLYFNVVGLTNGYCTNAKGEYIDGNNKVVPDQSMAKMQAAFVAKVSLVDSKGNRLKKGTDDWNILGSDIRNKSWARVDLESLRSLMARDGKNVDEYFSQARLALLVYGKQVQMELYATNNDEFDPQNPEDYYLWEVDKNPTCTTEGSQSCHCRRCNAVVYVTPIPVVDHNWKESERKNATCLGTGYVDYVCGFESSHTKHEILPLTGHRFTGNWTVVKEAGLSTGLESNICAVCGQKIYRVIPMPYAWDENGHMIDAATPKLTVTADTFRATPGSIVTVSAAVMGVYDTNRWDLIDFSLIYDPDKLEPVDAQPGSAVTSSVSITTEHTDTGVLQVVAMDGGKDGQSREGTVATVSFRVKSGLEPGETIHMLATPRYFVRTIVENGRPVGLAYLQLAGNQPVEMTVSDYTLGDVDSQNGITAADALMALQIATGKVTGDPTQQAAADVDGQNGVTAADALLILQYATGKIDQFAQL